MQIKDLNPGDQLRLTDYKGEVTVAIITDQHDEDITMMVEISTGTTFPMGNKVNLDENVELI